MPAFTYDTYQDVRKNLFRYSAITLNLAGFAAYQWILPPSHQQWVSKWFEYLSKNPVAGGLLKGGVGIAIFSGLAFVLIEFLKVHDRIYDKYVVRWRLRFDTDFILQRLLNPFGHRVSRKFYAEAERNLRDFMERLYYPFVGDRDGKIGKNAIVRFYERITIYWLTQVNEIIIGLVVALIAAYRFFGPPEDQYRAQLLTVLLAVIVVFLVNRLWMYSARVEVRQATAEQIDQITDQHQPDLEQRLQTLCAAHQIPFN
jgi:hypothetical protein